MTHTVMKKIQVVFSAVLLSSLFVATAQAQTNTQRATKTTSPTNPVVGTHTKTAQTKPLNSKHHGTGIL